MVTTLKRVFGALSDGSQSLSRTNLADRHQHQHTALVEMGMNDTQPQLWDFWLPHLPFMCVIFLFTFLDNNLKMVKSPSLDFPTAWATFLRGNR